MKSKTIPENDWRYFFQKEFDWSQPTVEQLYRFSYRAFSKKYFRQFYVNKCDFEDVFQESMLRLCLKIESGKCYFTTMRKAYSYLRSIFYNCTIDFLQHGNKLESITNELESNVSDTNTFEEVFIRYDTEDIEFVFSSLDAKLITQPKLLPATLYIFYQIYREAIANYTNDDAIRSFVMGKMSINKGYFGKLKSQLIQKLKELK